MCTNPIRIRNPALKFDRLTTQLYIDVPCGKCFECVERLRQDLTIRHYYEYKDSRNFCYFDTLTYNDASLPKFDQLPCFNSKHIIDFMKCIRIKLTRLGYDLGSDGVNNLKFSLTSEYGHLKGRPHYHLLWFSSVPNLTPMVLWSLTRQLWRHGFNDPYPIVKQHIVTNINALQYVSKYVGKDIYFEERFKQLLDSGYSLDMLEASLDNYRSFRPFRRSSLQFGSSIEQVDFDTLCFHGVPYFNNKGKHFMRLPRYNALHMLYDKVKEGDSFLYRLNSAGIDFKCKRLDIDIDKYTSKITNLLNNSSYDVQKDFYSTLGNRAIRDLAVYQRVFRGCQHSFGHSLPDYHVYYKDRLSTYDGRYLLDNPHLVNDHGKMLDYYSANIIKDSCHSHFVGFDYLCNLLEERFREDAKSRFEFQLFQSNQSKRTYEICQRFQIIS